MSAGGIMVGRGSLRIAKAQARDELKRIAESERDPQVGKWRFLDILLAIVAILLLIYIASGMNLWAIIPFVGLLIWLTYRGIFVWLIFRRRW